MKQTNLCGAFVENKAVKHDDNKPALELLPSAAVMEVAKVLSFGAKKYSANNWREGFDHSRIYGAILRHLNQWNDGEDRDEESSLLHTAHAACGILFLLEHQLKNLGKDDRFLYE